jgi:hypothetical protein
MQHLYLIHGEDLLIRAGPYQTIIVLAENEQAARTVIDREGKGFRIDHIESVKDYPKLNTRPAIIARITGFDPMH